MEEDFENVAALRTDGQGPPGRPQGQPLQHQDQAPVPAEPVQRHLHFRRARTQRAPKGVDQRAQERRSPLRSRCVFAQGESDRTVAPRAGVEAGDREEDVGGGAGEEGGLKLLISLSHPTRVYPRWVFYDYRSGIYPTSIGEGWGEGWGEGLRSRLGPANPLTRFASIFRLTRARDKSRARIVDKP